MIIDKNTKRIIIKFGLIKYLIKSLIKNSIDILIYQHYNYKEIKILNSISNFKTIFYNHSCFLYWIYSGKYKTFINLYDAYKNSKYVISLVPFENDFLFKKWGIDSILMNNFITYDYNLVIPSNLISKIILMIGRANDRLKRFELGIFAMKFILKEIQDCEMKIISNINEVKELEILVQKLNLEKFINFVGYTTTPEIYFRNASLHIFPTISESFGFALSETKIYGIPSILLGLDYVSSVKGGTIIIYDDKPETISRAAVKFLKNENYRNKLGKEARKSMKKFRNELTLRKWIKLIYAIIKGENHYKDMINNDNKIPSIQSINIIKNQLNLLKKRIKRFQLITYNNLLNFTFMKELILIKK